MELQKLREEYDAELKRFHIQKHLIDVLKKINVDQLKDIGPENKKNIAKALNSLHMIDFLKMENSGSTVLGECSIFGKENGKMEFLMYYGIDSGLPSKPIDLLYTEKKALRTQLVEDLPKTYAPVLSFAKTMDDCVFQPEKLNAELIALEDRRRQLTQDVAAAKIRECQVLQKCVDLKFGPNQKNIAELLRSNVSIDQIKGE